MRSHRVRRRQGLDAGIEFMLGAAARAHRRGHARLEPTDDPAFVAQQFEKESRVPDAQILLLDKRRCESGKLGHALGGPAGGPDPLGGGAAA